MTGDCRRKTSTFKAGQDPPSVTALHAPLSDGGLEPEGRGRDGERVPGRKIGSPVSRPLVQGQGGPNPTAAEGRSEEQAARYQSTRDRRADRRAERYNPKARRCTPSGRGRDSYGGVAARRDDGRDPFPS